MIAIYFEHFFEPLIGRQTFLKAYLTAQKSCVKLLSNYLRAQKSGFNLLSAFLSEFFFLSALLSTQKHTQGTSEPLWNSTRPFFLIFCSEIEKENQNTFTSASKNVSGIFGCN